MNARDPDLPFEMQSTNMLGLWVPLNRVGRRGWLDCAYARTFGLGVLPISEPNRLIELDGSQIGNLEGFFCAVGEAVNGPGGYFGRNLNGFADCAAGGFGVTRPWRLRWTNVAQARAALGRAETILHNKRLLAHGPFEAGIREYLARALDELQAGGGESLFTLLERILYERGATVEAC